MNKAHSIAAFLDCRRIAFVGVSSNPDDFSRSVLRELLVKGYEVVPVNPHVDFVGGSACYRDLSSIPSTVDGVLIMTPPASTEAVVTEAADLGIRRLWIHRGMGKGSVSDAAIRRCEERGLTYVSGECPLMFLGDPGWVHRLHALGKRLLGTYPGVGETPQPESSPRPS